MRSILITGAANGLGRAFLEHYAHEEKERKNRIFAVDVSWPGTTATGAAAAAVADTTTPTTATTDNEKNNQISYHQTDITSSADLDTLVKTLKSAGVSKLDLVIHSAGIRGLVVDDSAPTRITQSSDVAKAETLAVMTPATLLRTFEVNTVGTFQLIRHLLPFLRDNQHPSSSSFAASSSLPPSSSSSSSSPSSSPSKVIIMGSRMGSISSNTSAGGAYAYRASKAALNAIVKSLAIDMPDVCFLVVHPGRVATALCQGVREDNAMEPAEVLPGLVGLVEERCSLADSGRFVDRFGEDIGW